MLKIRETLQRLGWPVDEMSDRQVTRELYRRWFAARSEDMDEAGPLSIASAKGILASMASEGNLDALCWSGTDTIPVEEVLPEEERQLYDSSESREYARTDRRRSRRERARDLVRWCLSGEDSVGCTGWLINRSVEGMAFIASVAEAPVVGDEILPSIHSRTEGVINPGAATVVRIEPLNAELTLVCVRLVESGRTC